MSQEPSTINNSLFRDTIAGTLLFIGALIFTITKTSYTGVFTTLDTVIMSALTAAGLFLIAKAVKKDKYRFADEQE